MVLFQNRRLYFFECVQKISEGNQNITPSESLFVEMEASCLSCAIRRMPELVLTPANDVGGADVARQPAGRHSTGAYLDK